VAIDQTSSTSSPDSVPMPAIENEFPTYRAISSMAILSLVLGIASVFCFASLWFLTLVAGSVLVGMVAIRKIRQLPEVLTGAAYARVGIGLGLLFGLCAVTQVVSQEVMINLDAGRFARFYIKVIKDEPVSMALWFQQRPEYRKTKSPDEIAEELRKTKNPMSPDLFGEKTLAFMQIKDRLRQQGEEIRYVKIESKAVDGLTVHAFALFELAGPGSKEYPEKQFGLVQMLKGPGAGPDDWTVQEVRFPYTPASAVATVQKADDGHGHGH
jgi:hypothetical protein